MTCVFSKNMASDIPQSSVVLMSEKRREVRSESSHRQLRAHAKVVDRPKAIDKIAVDASPI